MLTAAPVVVSPSSAEWRAQAAALAEERERTADEVEYQMLTETLLVALAEADRAALEEARA